MDTCEGLMERRRPRGIKRSSELLSTGQARSPCLGLITLSRLDSFPHSDDRDGRASPRYQTTHSIRGTTGVQSRTARALHHLYDETMRTRFQPATRLRFLSGPIRLSGL